MRLITQIFSWVALAGTILPSILYLNGSLTLVQMKSIMLVSTVVWFIATPLWMERRRA